jgi:hypothetical protein
MGWRRASGWIVRACRAYRGYRDGHGEDEAELDGLEADAWQSDAEVCLGAVDGQMEVWDLDPDGTCGTCACVLGAAHRISLLVFNGGAM